MNTANCASRSRATAGYMYASQSLRWLIIPLFLVMSLSRGAHADGISVSAGLSRTTVPFDSTVTLRIALSWPGDQFAYLITSALKPEAERLSLLRYTSTAATSGTAQTPVTTKTYEFVFQPTSAGSGKILPITIHYRLATQVPTDTTQFQLVTEPLLLTIDEPEIARKKGAPALIPYPLGYWLLGVLALSTTFVVVLVIRSRRPQVPQVSLEEQLLVKIGELRGECGDDVKRFQTGVYKELVHYVARANRVDLSGMMTDDIVHVIDASQMPEERKVKIGAWLLQAQRQKFSPAAFSSAEVLRLEQEIRLLFEHAPTSTV